MVAVRTGENFKLKDRERKRISRERLRLNPVEYDKFLEKDRARKSLLLMNSRGKAVSKTKNSLRSSPFDTNSITPITYNQSLNFSNHSVHDIDCSIFECSRNNFSFLTEILKLACDELNSIV